MIQANELRKGNKVDYFGEIHTIQNVGNWCHTDLSSDEIPLDQCKPIPLTEEWIFKLGFDKIENNWKCLDLFFCILGWERLAGLTLTLDKESIYLPYINTVHQLQNLYFALTGEELNYNK